MNSRWNLAAATLLWPPALLLLLALIRPFGPEGPLYVQIEANTPGLEPGVHLTFAGQCLRAALIALIAGAAVHLFTRFLAARFAIGPPFALGLCALIALANTAFLWICLVFIPLFAIFFPPLLAFVFIAAIFAPLITISRSPSAEPKDLRANLLSIDARKYLPIQELLVAQPGISIRCFVTLSPEIRTFVEPEGIGLVLPLTLARILSCSEFASAVGSVLSPMAMVDRSILRLCAWHRRIERLTTPFFGRVPSQRLVAALGDLFWIGPVTHAMLLSHEIAALQPASDQTDFDTETASKTFFAHMAWHSALWRERAKLIKGNISIEFVEALRRGEFDAIDEDWEDPDLEPVEDKPVDIAEPIDETSRLNFQPETAAITWFPDAEVLELDLSRRLQHDASIAIAPRDPLAVE